MKIKEIIVVEGKDDTTAVQQSVSADTIETNGSAINTEIIEKIRLAQETRGVIILTDPDYPWTEDPSYDCGTGSRVQACLYSKGKGDRKERQGSRSRACFSRND